MFTEYCCGLLTILWYLRMWSVMLLISTWAKTNNPSPQIKLKHTKKPAAIIFSARHVLRRLRLRSIDASGGMPAGNAGPNMFACVRAMLARGAARTGSNVYIFKLASEVWSGKEWLSTSERDWGSLDDNTLSFRFSPSFGVRPRAGIFWRGPWY